MNPGTLLISTHDQRTVVYTSVLIQSSSCSLSKGSMYVRTLTFLILILEELSSYNIIIKLEHDLVKDDGIICGYCEPKNQVIVIIRVDQFS